MCATLAATEVFSAEAGGGVGDLEKTGASLGYLYISINGIFCQDRAGRMF